MALTRIDVLVMFNEGSATAWNNVTIPVPAGAFIIDDVNKEIRKGDGTTLFSNLPVVLDYGFADSVSGAVEPANNEEGNAAIASGGQYTPSTVLFGDLLNAILDAQNKEGAQDSRYSTLNAGLKVSDVIPADEGVLVMSNGGVYQPSTLTFAQLVADIVAAASIGEGKPHIERLNWYSDKDLINKIPVDKALIENNTSYCEIDAFHDNAELSNINFGLSVGVSDNIVIKNSKEQVTESFLMSLYGGTGNDRFYGVTVDSLNNNIICAGYTDSEGQGSYDTLVVKFDSSLNILARKIYGGTGGDYFNGVGIDSNDNIICVGWTSSEGQGLADALVVKFDSSLNILARKSYGGTGDDWFSGVTVDSNNNIIIAGYTTSEGQGSYDALVVKFDSNLNILARKIYGGTGGDVVYSVKVDSNDNIICVGWSSSEGQGASECLVIKFDSSLNILARKVYGGSVGESFYTLSIDSTDNIICVGYTGSEGQGGQDALVVKFDNSLNILARKVYGGTVDDWFRDVAIDSNGNIICVGYTNSEGQGLYDALVVKFDSSLNILARKIYGGTGDDWFDAVTIDSNDNIICAGRTSSEGQGNADALVVKLPSDLPNGILESSSGLMTMTQSNLTLADSALILADSALILADSALILADSTLTVADSALTQVLDTVETSTNPLPDDKLLTTLFYGDQTDLFHGLATDAAGNVYAVGSTTSAGTAGVAVLVKMDGELNILVRKQFDGNAFEEFRDVAIDSNGNIICVGQTQSEGQGNGDALIVKLSSTFTVSAQKVYGGSTGAEVFNAVIIDGTDNIFCCGSSNGAALVVKFDSSVAVTAAETYSGTGTEQGYFNDIAIDAAGSIVCIGSIYITADAKFNGVVVKYTNALVIIAHMSCGIAANQLDGIATDSNNNVFCVGWRNDGTSDNATVFKLDASLTLQVSKEYGSDLATPNDERFTAVQVDADDNVFCFGYTTSEGAGNKDFSVVKLDNALSAIFANKTYGSVNDDGTTNRGILDEVNGRVIFCGDTITPQSVNPNAMVCSLPIDLREGTYTNKDLNTLALTDGKLTIKAGSLAIAANAYVAASVLLTTSTSTAAYGDNTNGFIQDVTIMDAVGNVFEVSIGETIARNATDSGILSRMYGGAGDDQFRGVAIDSLDNIICAGYTSSEGQGSFDALVVKFDSSLNILARKVYGGVGDDLNWHGMVTVDSLDNIIVVGFTTSEGLGSNDGLIVKFDSSLNILARKVYGGTGNDYFRGVAVDSLDNIICAGLTSSEGQGSYDGLVVKFDSSLNILARKIYGGAGDDRFYGVAVDSNDNIVCAGVTTSEGQGNYGALVVKFDSSLNILARKIYGGTGDDQFRRVVVDSLDNVICAGMTTSEGQGINDGLIVKFDSSLNILARKIYGGAGDDYFIGVAVDSNGNIICSGYAYSEGQGNYDALVVKFDSSLNILARKVYGGTGADYFLAANVDSNDNIICSGIMTINGSNHAAVVKFPAAIPQGRFFNEVHNELICTESALVLADSNLVLADSTLTLANSNLTLANSNLTLSESYLKAYDIARCVTTDKPTGILVNLYGGAGTDTFRGVAVDSLDNIICAGVTTSEGQGLYDFLIVKFDSSLNILARKIYGGIGDDINWHSMVAIDSNDNIILIGWTASEGQGGNDALVVKFDSSLNILARKIYGGAGTDQFRGVTIDSLDNIICAGYTTSEGQGSNDALVVKFDSSLNILARKVYGGTGSDLFYEVTIDSLDSIICAGVTDSEGQGSIDALVVKFDSSLNILARKIYGGALDDQFRGVAVDSNDHIICAGYAYSEGIGSHAALVIKFDSSLNILARKRYDGTGGDYFVGVTVDSNDNIICAGATDSEGLGTSTVMVVKFPSDIPSGKFVSPAYPALIGNDSDLTLSDSNLILANSALTLANSNLTLADSTLTLADSNLLIDMVGTCTVPSLTNRFTDYIQQFTATVNDGNTAVRTKVEEKAVTFSSVLVSLYGGIGTDYLYRVAVDSNDNIICAGFTASEGQGGYDALVVKFDSSLNILARKIYGGAGSDYFNGVVIDSLDNIICDGYTTSEGQGSNDALVVKFDSSLNILARKIYGGAGDDYFRRVTVDSLDNIICAGTTGSEGQGLNDALVVKFDSSLNILARKVYGGIGSDYSFGVTIDSNDNIICAGYTTSEGQGGWDALVVKFDSSLNILARKIYGGTGDDYFNGVSTDSLDNIICVGYTASEGQGGADGLVVKFDSSLNILARKVYGGTANDWFNVVTVDSNDNIICAGRLLSSAQGSNSAGFLVKFDSSLNILGSKFFGLSTDGSVTGVIADSNDNIIVSGWATETTNVEAMVVKFPSDIPSGTFTGTVLTGLTLADSTLTLADSTLTLADSTLTLADSTLTLADSTLTLSNSLLEQEVDTLG